MAIHSGEVTQAAMRSAGAAALSRASQANTQLRPVHCAVRGGGRDQRLCRFDAIRLPSGMLGSQVMDTFSLDIPDESPARHEGYALTAQLDECCSAWVRAGDFVSQRGSEHARCYHRRGGMMSVLPAPAVS